MTKEQLSDMAAEAYNRLGKNPPPYQWMDGYVAGYVAGQQNLQQCNVSRSKCDYHAAFTFCGDNGITYCSNCGDPV